MINLVIKTHRVLQQWESLPDVESKYLLLIHLGQLADITVLEPRFKVPGCVASTYINGYLKEGYVHLKYYSESKITAGIIAIIQTLLKEKKACEITRGYLESVIEVLNIQHLLSYQRQIGITQVINKIYSFIIPMV